MMESRFLLVFGLVVFGWSGGAIAQTATSPRPCGVQMSSVRSSQVSINGRRTGYRESIQMTCNEQGLPITILDYTARKRGQESQIVLRSDLLGERKAAFEAAIRNERVTASDRAFFVEHVMPLLKEKKMAEASELWLQQILRQ